jgi:site-specific recombinase XerD
MKTRPKTLQNTLPKFWQADWPDTVSAWAEAYLRLEVTTSARSRQEQRRDLRQLCDFLGQTLSPEEAWQWTPRLSRLFIDHLCAARVRGQRRWSDRTVNRIVAHVKTFATWVHTHRPFPLGNPMAKIKSLPLTGGLEIARALTAAERRRLLDAADYLPVIGGRSRDQRRFKHTAPAERPRRKGYRPWRNRAIVYLLIETGIRRAEVTSIDLADVDFTHATVLITAKGGQRRRCLASQAGLHAVRDYLDHERAQDAAHWESPALLLPAASVGQSTGRLTPTTINQVWNAVCRLAGVTGKTPHAARHAMGLHIVKKTGNPRAVQRQLGHTNPATTMQYLHFAQEELQTVLDDR